MAQTPVAIKEERESSMVRDQPLLLIPVTPERGGAAAELFRFITTMRTMGRLPVEPAVLNRVDRRRAHAPPRPAHHREGTLNPDDLPFWELVLEEREERIETSIREDFMLEEMAPTPSAELLRIEGRVVTCEGLRECAGERGADPRSKTFFR